MDTQPARTYILIGDPERRPGEPAATFTSTEPTGTVISTRLRGRQVRIHLTGDPLICNRYTATLQVDYI